ncbi:MAG: protease modulator HflC [Steroidobacteraceae bacterium]
MQRGTPILFLVIGALLLASSCVFTVGESQVAIRTQFKEIVGEPYGPGLHFKTPIDSVVRFERRVLSQSFPGETFLTNENRGLIVDFYIKWRVDDPSKFFESFGTSEESAAQRLSDIVKDGIKNAVAQRTLEQIVTAERTAFTGDMFERASSLVDDLGVELIDVRVQRIDLPEDVAARVYASMQQSFERLARQLRGEGEKEALRIRAEADRKRLEIVSDASRKALQIRGEGDTRATQIYAGAYSRDPEFYAFYRSIQAYKNSLGREGDILVVSPEGEFFRYLRGQGGGR